MKTRLMSLALLGMMVMGAFTLTGCRAPHDDRPYSVRGDTRDNMDDASERGPVQHQDWARDTRH